jgi:integrase
MKKGEHRANGLAPGTEGDASMQAKRIPTGIRVRHSRSCASTEGRKCSCNPSYEAWVYDKRTNTKRRRTFTGRGALTAAKAWRRDASPLVVKGALVQSSGLTLQQAWDDWVGKAEAGEILSRHKRPYKGSTLRGYRSDMKEYVLDDFGAHRLSELTADDFQNLVERLIGKGLSGQKVRNVLVPCQALYRRYRRQVMSDPTDGLDLPEGAERRERAAAPKEATELLEPLADDVAAIYATAFYAGLRRGELRALRVSNLRGLDGEGVAAISVEHSWDDYDGEVDPKSRAGAREVPVPATLRTILADHVKRTKRSGNDFVFGRAADKAFTPTHIRKLAAKAWETANVERAEKELPALVPIGLHEARHSYSSYLDAAGIPETRADRYMGHSNPSVANRYRHQLDGQLLEDAATLEAYLSGVKAGKVVALDDYAVAR